MKIKPTSLLLTLVNCLLLIVHCKSQSLEFRKDTAWASVLSAAKTQHKPIFLDVYTTWCKPCKQMEREIFSLYEVGKKINTNFVSYRIDAEKGEGLGIASSYQVDAYPSVFFLDSKGNPVHKIEGLVSSEQFLRETDFAINLLADENPLSYYQYEFKKGNRNTLFLYKFLKKKALYKEDTGEILEEYVKQLPFDSLNSSKTWSLILEHATLLKGRAFELLMSRRNEDKITQKLVHIRAGAFNLAIRKQDEKLLQEALSVTQRTSRTESEAQETMLSQQMLFYVSTKNIAKVPLFAEPYLNQYLLQKTIEPAKKQAQNQIYDAQLSTFYASQLGKVAQFYVENFKGKTQLEKALIWAKRSVELAEKSSNLDTYAHLLLKLGNLSEAKITQEKAINLAKNAKEDAAYINYLKEELEKMRL
jgi:thioredoxin-related protein